MSTFQEAYRNDTKSIRQTRIINPATGEYKETNSYVDNMFSSKGYVYRCNSNYIKLFFDKGLPEHYTLTECGKFYRLIKYIVGDNQLLGYREDKIYPLTIEKMTEMFGCTDRQVRRFIKKMKDDRIIKEVSINDTKWYAINPMYALKSKYLSLTTFIIFQDELIGTIPFNITSKFLSEVREITDKIEIKE